MSEEISTEEKSRKHKERKERVTLAEPIAGKPALYWTLSLLALFLLCILTVGTAFLGWGCTFLIREGVLWMGEEEYANFMSQYEQTTLSGLLETELDTYGDLLHVYATPPTLEDGYTNEIISSQMAKAITRFVITSYMDNEKETVDRFFSNLDIQYSLYLSSGRRLFGNLPVNDEKYSWRCRGLLYDGKYYNEVYVVRLKLAKNAALAIKPTNTFLLECFFGENRYVIAEATAAGLLLCLLLLGCLLGMAAAMGKHSQTPLFYVPAELLILSAAGVLFFLGKRIWAMVQEGWVSAELIIGMSLGFSALLYFTLAHLARRMKVREWYKKSLLYQLIPLTKRTVAGWRKAILNLNMTWKFFVLLLSVSALELTAILVLLPWELSTYLLIGLWILEKILLFPVILNYGGAITSLQKAAAEIAVGNLEYQVDVDSLPRIFKPFGRDVSSMAGSIALAVEDQLKSERMKTELITNVSHDIKTPLTSIINFSDLISREESDNPKITEYAELLNKQSSRLKKLIEDLMEASKASTGNLEVHLEPCDVKILLEQCLGEFEQRLTEQGLELVIKHPQDSVNIMADTRMIWRVFENLMNNICKYAQRDTRVYLSTECTEEEVQITFKNVSKYRLDIPPEELMERFVRGDLSRHTEGSGLGLSIVSSLMELQGGRITLATDGDLFKAILTFSLIKA